MNIFQEAETIRRIKVMKSSGLKYTKLKMVNDMQEVIQNLYEDKYDDLMQFKINNIDFLKELIERVYQHNLNIYETDNQAILLFFEKPLEMMAAATRIQCAYRLYKWRKSLEITPLTRIMRRRGTV